jgi:hypothetical protein
MKVEVRVRVRVEIVVLLTCFYCISYTYRKKKFLLFNYYSHFITSTLKEGE